MSAIRKDRRPEISQKGTAGARAPAAEIERESNPLKKAGMVLGPGFITGASDDDPSGVGTYALAGASLGLQTLWTALLGFPLMAAVQTICGRVGMVTGCGLAAVLDRYYARPVVLGAVGLLFVANTINVGADLAAVADAVKILTGVDAFWIVVPVALAILGVQVFGSYALIARVFKWLTLALFAYVADAFIVHPDLGPVLRATFVPTISFDPAFLATIVAILGTTISPYLFFWQSDQEVEEEIAEGKRTLEQRKGATEADKRYATVDTVIGMAFSQLVMYFIILSTGLTLFPSGKTDIKSGADAAEALRPLAGDLAGTLFALGMIGAGLLAIPILSGSAAYAVSEAFGWRRGLDRRWDRAKPFYAVIAAATLIGTAMSFVGIDPIQALFWTAVVNGTVAPPLLVLVMLAARNERIMGRHRIGPVLTILGWTATGAMFLALAGLAYTTVFAPPGG